MAIRGRPVFALVFALVVALQGAACGLFDRFPVLRVHNPTGTEFVVQAWPDEPNVGGYVLRVPGSTVAKTELYGVGSLLRVEVFSEACVQLSSLTIPIADADLVLAQDGSLRLADSLDLPRGLAASSEGPLAAPVCRE